MKRSRILVLCAVAASAMRRKPMGSLRTSRVRVTLAAVCFGLLALPSSGSADNEKNCGCKNKEAVYKSVIVGTGPAPDFSPTNRCAPGGTATINSTGNDTLLGAFSSTQSHCIAPPSSAFTNGEFTATDTDGNELTGTYAGNLVPTSEPNVFLIDGRFFFTSGGFIGEGAAGGRVVFNADGTTDAIVVIDGCITTKKL